MVREMLGHSVELPPTAICPKRHFEELVTYGLSLSKYLEDHIDRDGIYETVYGRHFGQLRRMVLADLIESFERYLKELASTCIDLLAPWFSDDRFDEFKPRGRDVAAINNGVTVGQAMCEADTWLNNEEINKRFSKLLKPQHSDQRWQPSLFPDANPQPVTVVDRTGQQINIRDQGKTLAILWQVRHSLAHNVGVLTNSDAAKLRLLAIGPVAHGRRLAPTSSDLRYVHRFLIETADLTDFRVSARIGELLTAVIQADPTVFDRQEVANLATRSLGDPVTIDGVTGVS
jgi:hypothetical protein